MVKYTVTLKKENKAVGTYHLDGNLFSSIEQYLKPYRSIGAQPKAVRCVETGEVFRCANQAARTLYHRNITDSSSAVVSIKSVCKGKRKLAYGFHWEFIEEGKCSR